jgi:hypothetical protein
MITFLPKLLILAILTPLLFGACDTDKGWKIHSIYVDTRSPVARVAAEEFLFQKNYRAETEGGRGAAEAVLEIADPTATQNQNVYYAGVSMRLLGPPDRQIYWSAQTQGLGTTPNEALRDAISLAMNGTHSVSVSGMLQTALGVFDGTAINAHPLPRRPNYKQTATSGEGR